MLGDIDRESLEAPLALLLVAGAAGVLVGSGIVTVSDRVLGYSGFVFGLVLVALLVSRVVEWLLAAGEVPGLGITIDAPNNATTGFYAAGLAVMIVGLVAELATGQPTPWHIVLFVAGAVACFERGFRRGVDSDAGRVSRADGN